MILELLAIVAPLYVCVGLGFAWARTERHFDIPFVTSLIMDVGAPCLVFSSLTSRTASAPELSLVLCATLIALAGFALVGALALRVLGLPRQSFLAPIVFGNAGNMGLPVCLFAFGEPGLALAVGFFSVNAIVHNTVGLWLWSGRISGVELARTPIAWSAAASAIVLWLGIPIPKWLADTLHLLGGITIPLMQLTLGVSLARFLPARVGRALGISGLRFAVGLGVGLIVSRALGLTGTPRGVFLVECAMPVAVFNYMLAARYDRDAQEIAGVVAVSTLLSFATLPVVLAFLI